MIPWVPDTHGWVKSLRTDADWSALADEYGASAGRPLARVFDVARSARCRTVIVENRYVDADYRSEYSAFWSQRFESTSAFTHRLHFFRKELSDDSLHRLPRNPGYLGYAVVPPTPRGRVGRTVIAPPQRLQKATLALVKDEVSLFGNRLPVTGAPFCEQDGEFLRCAHAAAWMCHYSAYRRRLVGRHVTANVVELSPSLLLHERPLPSKGMNLNQLQAVFGATGQPALFYGLANMPSVRGVDDPVPVRDRSGRQLPPGLWDTRIFSVLARYLNSGFPVLIATTNHAFIVVGWFRDGSRIRFVATDDQQGPFELIQSPFTDHRGPWQGIMVPLPPKVFLSGEMAENAAHLALRAFGSASEAPGAWGNLARAVATKSVSLRTFLREGSAYKHALDQQARHGSAVRELRLARLPHWVWVVEAHDRDKRAAGLPSVVAECVFDSTSNDRSPRQDAISLPGLTATFPPDGGRPSAVTTASEPWSSQLTRPA